MWRDFEGGIYWDELAEICGDISRAARFQGVARFRGKTAHSSFTQHLEANIQYPSYTCILLQFIAYYTCDYLCWLIQYKGVCLISRGAEFSEELLCKTHTVLSTFLTRNPKIFKENPHRCVGLMGIDSWKILICFIWAIFMLNNHVIIIRIKSESLAACTTYTMYISTIFTRLTFPAPDRHTHCCQCVQDHFHSNAGTSSSLHLVEWRTVSTLKRHHQPRTS